jgi:hypothetical protein
MKAFDQIRKHLFKSKDRKNLQEEVHEENEPKPFGLEWESTYYFAKKWGVIPSILSAVSTAFNFPPAFPKLPWAIALIIGLVLAWFYEKAKNFTSQKGYKLYYQKGQIILLAVSCI